jgi:hypothetical protein
LLFLKIEIKSLFYSCSYVKRHTIRLLYKLATWQNIENKGFTVLGSSPRRGANKAITNVVAFLFNLISVSKIDRHSRFFKVSRNDIKVARQTERLLIRIPNTFDS